MTAAPAGLTSATAAPSVVAACSATAAAAEGLRLFTDAGLDPKKTLDPEQLFPAPSAAAVAAGAAGRADAMQGE